MFGNSTRKQQEQQIAALRQQVAKLEILVGRLAERADIDGPGLDRMIEATWPISHRVRALADSGKTIEAIKVHRRETGAGLKDAKEMVDVYLARQD